MSHQCLFHAPFTQWWSWECYCNYNVMCEMDIIFNVSSVSVTCSLSHSDDPGCVTVIYVVCKMGIILSVSSVFCFMLLSHINDPGCVPVIYIYVMCKMGIIFSVSSVFCFMLLSHSDDPGSVASQEILPLDEVPVCPPDCERCGYICLQRQRQ